MLSDIFVFSFELDFKNRTLIGQSEKKIIPVPAIEKTKIKMTIVWCGLTVVNQLEPRPRQYRQSWHCALANQILCFSQIPIPRAQNQRCNSFQSPNNNRTQCHQLYSVYVCVLREIFPCFFSLYPQHYHAFNEKLLPRKFMVKERKKRRYGISNFGFSRPASSEPEGSDGRVELRWCFRLWPFASGGRYRLRNKSPSLYVSYSGSFQKIYVVIFVLWNSNGTYWTGQLDKGGREEIENLSQPKQTIETARPLQMIKTVRSLGLKLKAIDVFRIIRFLEAFERAATTREEVEFLGKACLRLRQPLFTLCCDVQRTTWCYVTRKIWRSSYFLLLYKHLTRISSPTYLKASKELPFVRRERF